MNANQKRIEELLLNIDEMRYYLKSIYNLSHFDWETMPEGSKRKYHELIIELANDALSASATSTTK